MFRPHSFIQQILMNIIMCSSNMDEGSTLLPALITSILQRNSGHPTQQMTKYDLENNILTSILKKIKQDKKD